MIPDNDRQAALLNARVDRASASLRDLESWDSLKTGIAPSVIELRKKSLRETITRLKGDLSQYEVFRSGEVKTFDAGRIEDLPEILKKARVASGLTQRQFGDLLGVKEQQVQRYEADNYMTLSLHRLYEISATLGLEFSIKASINEGKIGALPDSIVDVSKFPYKEIVRRQWISNGSGADVLSNEQIDNYISTNLGRNWGKFLNRQVVRSNARLNDYSLLAWQARICERGRAVRRKIKSEFFSLGLDWVGELVSQSKYDDGPRRAIEYLESIGVIVVIEPHLEKTHLDGAATVLDGDFPLIGLTLRYDRLDNFWFVLLHELGHLALHMQSGDTIAFFDAEDEVATSGRESEADDFARTCLISDEKWKSSLVRFAKSGDAVTSFAKLNGISPAIVAGRIRRERGNFSVFNELVGWGRVRKQFGI